MAVDSNLRRQIQNVESMIRNNTTEQNNVKSQIQQANRRIADLQQQRKTLDRHNWTS